MAKRGKKRGPQKATRLQSAIRGMVLGQGRNWQDKLVRWVGRDEDRETAVYRFAANAVIAAAKVFLNKSR